MSSIENWAAILVGLGLGGVVVEGFRFILHRRNMGADAAETVTRAAVGLVEPLQKRITELEADLSATEKHAAGLDKDLKEATAIVVQLTRELAACREELSEFRKMLGPHAPTE